MKDAEASDHLSSSSRQRIWGVSIAGLALSWWVVMIVATALGWDWPAHQFGRLIVVGGLARLFVGLVAIVIAAILALRGVEGRAVRALVIVLACAGVMTSGDSYGEAVLGLVLWRLAYAGSIGLALGGLLLFAISFPKPISKTQASAPGPLRWLRRWQLPVIDSPRLAWVLGVGFGLGWYVVLTMISREQTFFNWGLYPATPHRFAALMVANAMTVAALIAVCATIRVSYVTSGRQDRRKILWIAQGAVMGVAIYIFVELATLLHAWMPTGLLAPIFPWLITIGKPLTLLAVISGFALAIFVGGAFDTGWVLKRTTILGLGGSGALLVFAVLENVMSALIEAELGLPGMLGAVTAGLLVALLALPFRTLLRSLESKMLIHSSTTESDVEVGAPISVGKNQT